jgi:uncharacterized membrane protein (DUF485 family)
MYTLAFLVTCFVLCVVICFILANMARKDESGFCILVLVFLMPWITIWIGTRIYSLLAYLDKLPPDLMNK